MYTCPNCGQRSIPVLRSFRPKFTCPNCNAVLKHSITPLAATLIALPYLVYALAGLVAPGTQGVNGRYWIAIAFIASLAIGLKVERFTVVHEGGKS